MFQFCCFLLNSERVERTWSRHTSSGVGVLIYTAERDGGGRSRSFPSLSAQRRRRLLKDVWVHCWRQRRRTSKAARGSWPSGFKRDESIIWLNFACSVSFLTVLRLHTSWMSEKGGSIQCVAPALNVYFTLCVIISGLIFASLQIVFPLHQAPVTAPEICIRFLRSGVRLEAHLKCWWWQTQVLKSYSLNIWWC